MRKVIIVKKESDEIELSIVYTHTPIFAKKEGRFRGMLVKEDRNPGWIVRTGGSGGASGYHETREKCLESCLRYGYTFFVELRE